MIPVYFINLHPELENFKVYHHQRYNYHQILLLKMSRRRVSPVKPRTFTDTSPHPDEREQIIGRLKEELVLARGKEK